MRRIVGTLCALAALVVVPAAAGRVLLVGTFHGIAGGYGSIQSAVDAAHAGDYILVAPGDYKEQADHRRNRGPQPDDYPGGVVIAKSHLTLRGMNRNTVIVDGTKPGSSRCSTNPAAQDYGPTEDGKHIGRNGILIWEANDVTVQNLTICNFLNGPGGDNGNEIWWQGGHENGGIGGYGYLGTYLSATSTFFSNESTAAQYGIFSSHWSGGTWAYDYASNFNDSGFYIGACKQVCDQEMNHDQGEYNALGYSGSNSGGWMLIENSVFDNNEDGFDTNSQNGDNPAPQNGACPAGVNPPVRGAPTCWVFIHNVSRDNNNPNIPSAGSAAAGPVGTGMSVSGGRNDTIMDNQFSGDDAWGVIFVPYPDSGPPCDGGTVNSPFASCLFDEWGDHLLDNTFTDDGRYGNPTNGEFEALNLEQNPTDCFAGNRDTGGSLDAQATQLESKYPTCSTTPEPPDTGGAFLGEVLCDSQVVIANASTCTPTDHYPRRTRVVIHPLPTEPAMPNPCAGVPANPWCVRGHPRRA